MRCLGEPEFLRNMVRRNSRRVFTGTPTFD
jgi:hypothetical protein